MLTLTIAKRDTTEKIDAIRSSGKIPAVFYGRKEESTSISISRKEFEKLWRAAGESTVISLEGVGEAKQALIHEVALDPVSDTPLHVDFYVVEKGAKVQTAVPLVFIGEAPAVKSLGGTLVKVMHEVEVEALPKDLPHELTVDISTLETFDSNIAIKDIAVPEGVVLMADPDETVVAVSEPKEEEEEPVAQIDMEAIEVEKKGKKEEEEEGVDAAE